MNAGLAWEQEKQSSENSECAARATAMRSPHDPQTAPSMDLIRSRHASQTGSEEMVVKGSAQKRQVEGNRTANRPSAAAVNVRTSFRPNLESARAGSPLLLKTSSLPGMPRRETRPAAHHRTATV